MCLTLNVANVAAEDPENVPGMITDRSTSVDLDFWKVTLPINELGKTSGIGDAVEFRALEGLAVPPYFDVKPDSVTFMAPTNGARTGGSNYPRSELREMDGNGNRYEWLAADVGRLAAILQVDELPVAIGKDAVSRIVIGQIHGPADELCRLYYDEDGHVYFVDDKAGGKQEERTFNLVAADGSEATIPLGARFSYSIEADAEKLVVTVTYDGVEYTGTDMLSAFWPDKPLYFKAGVYSQVGLEGTEAHTVGTGQGQATFFEISKPTHDLVRLAGELTSSDGDDAKSEAVTASGDARATDGDIYAGCAVVVTAQQLDAGKAYSAAKERAYKMCESVQEEFSVYEKSLVDEVVDSFFPDAGL
ncbi:Alginate lyase [Devosia psychrophila]|uniref:Alginate lyase n=2 Tax=Devosia psychrophila TaxID=728005 RepID=A0A1I1QI18_9HYPH|nr:Alginate lyase [Devosia psychrophila]